MSAPAASVPVGAPRAAAGSWFTGARRAGALLLALLSLLPLYNWLDRPDAGLAGSATAAMTSAYASFLWAGTAGVCAVGLLAAVLVSVEQFGAAARRAAGWLTRPDAALFGAILALIAASATLLFSFRVLGAEPNLIDTMSQLVHARYLANGMLAGPVNEFGAAWTQQQALFTSHGWVSQYPPGHIVLLALAMRLGSPWIAGPVLLAVAVFFTALAAARLLPEKPAVARLGALLLAVSPFLIAQAGALMNHVTAAAFGAVAMYCGLRAAGGRPVWALLSGGATGALFATRPLAGITIGAVVLIAAITGRDARRDRRVTTIAAFALSALPFLLLVGAWNAHFFGSPVRFGYEAALGNAGGLGFGIDPWGNVYGPTHALAYTAAELTALSLFLFETPIPLVAVIALALALAPRLTRGEHLLTAWAVLPLAAGVFYWHHGLFMGPRMLADAGPAWAVLAAWGCVTLVARIPDRIPATRFSPRTFVGCALLAAFAAGPLFLGISRLSSYGSGASPLARTAAAAPAGSLVFVHGGWPTRIAMRLAATGMRLDSVETALRRNPTCRVQEYADARAARSTAPSLDFQRRAGRPANLERIEVSPGNTILLGEGETLSPRCRAETAADRFGVLEVAPILWAGDLPGIETGRPAFVRDLGPHANNRLITQHGREAWALLADPQNGTPRLVRYEEAMDLLWTRMEAR